MSTVFTDRGRADPEVDRRRLSRHPRRSRHLRVDRDLLRRRDRRAGREPRRVRGHDPGHHRVHECVRHAAALRPAVQRRRRTAIGDRERCRSRRAISAAASAAVGQSLHLEDRTYTIVGVRSRLVPVSRTHRCLDRSGARPGDPGTHRVQQPRRRKLRDGVSVEAANARLATLAGSWPPPIRTATRTRASRSGRCATNSSRRCEPRCSC